MVARLPAHSPIHYRDQRRCTQISGALIGRTQVHSQSQVPFFQTGLGVADHGEILEIELGLLNETLPFRPRNWRKRTTFHRRSTLDESGEHVLRFETSHK